MVDALEQNIGMQGSMRGQITRTEDGKIKPPQNIIATPAAARALYFKYRTEGVKRVDLYARIDGLIAGNPPYNPVELQKQGLGHIANFNPLDARALYERGANAYWNLLNSTETLVKFIIRPKSKDEPVNPHAIEWSDSMARHFDYVLRSWPSFITNMNMHSAQLVKFGISPILWPDENDWRWRFIDVSKFYVSDQQQCDMEQLTCCCVESFFTVQWLWEKYDEIESLDKTKTPWDKNEIAELLLWYANTFAKTSGDGIIDWADMQRRRQNGDLGQDALFSDSIRIISLLYKEYDGKISHYMFHRNYDAGQLLYFADRQYDSMQDAILIFTASPGEYTLHSNRGLGHKIFAPAQAMMQADCSIVDAMRWAATPMLKTTAVGSKDIQQIRIIPGTCIDIGTAEFQQNTIGDNIQQLTGGSQYFMQKMQYNLASAGDDPASQDSSNGSVSNGQDKRRSFREFGVLKHNIAHYYTQADMLFKNVVIKMLTAKKDDPGYEYVKEWKDRCIADGVPEDMFDYEERAWPFKMPRHLDVRASRVAGDGSTLARIMSLEQVQAMIGPSFGPREIHEWKREVILATLGADYIPAFLPDAAGSDEETGGSSVAGVENAIMQLGQSPVFSTYNDQEAHFSTHLALGVQTMQHLKEQALDPIAADKILNVLAQHMGQHWQTLAQFPLYSAYVQEHKQYWQQLQKVVVLNRKNAEGMLGKQIKDNKEADLKLQAAQKDEQRKDMVAQGSEKRADFKVQSQVDRAKEASDQRGEVVQSTADAKNAALAATTRHKMSLAAEEHAAKMQEKKSAALADPKAALDEMLGNTPAPSDIEMALPDVPALGTPGDMA